MMPLDRKKIQQEPLWFITMWWLAITISGIPED